MKEAESKVGLIEKESCVSEKILIENELRQVKRRYTELCDRYDVRVCPAAACVCVHVYVCIVCYLIIASCFLDNYNH